MNLQHNQKSLVPERVVVLGANGFIGKNLIKTLEEHNVNCLPLKREDIDLIDEKAVDQLSDILKTTDALVFLSTVTPDRSKDINAFMHNIRLAETVSKVLQKVTPAQVIYLSSDTVYSLDRGIISETSPQDPANTFGIMHLAREYLLKDAATCPLAILRSTLVYGVEDTHNSYGPNRMRRQAHKDGRIPLFGNGEENRDHIYIKDLVNLIYQVLLHKSSGIINLSTGNSISYYDLAHKIANLFDSEITVESSLRQNPITHRHFDSTLVYQVFPGFTFTPLEKGLEEVHIEELRLQACLTNEIINKGK